MQHMKVSGAVRPLKWSLDLKWLTNRPTLIGLYLIFRKYISQDIKY